MHINMYVYVYIYKSIMSLYKYVYISLLRLSDYRILISVQSQIYVGHMMITS